MPRLRLATRGSEQARTQTLAVAAAVMAAHPRVEVELVIVETRGDQRVDVPLHQIGGQGIFVKEVQQAVLDGRADAAVHSAKDLPAATAPGLVIGAFTARRDPRDALVGARLDDLPIGATVASGSVRRRAQLALLRPDLQFAELRGNIPSRLSKVPEGGAVVVACAALEVLGRTNEAAEVLPVSTMIPMVGQGCVAVECAVGDSSVRELLTSVDDPGTRAAVVVERAFLAELGGGCTMPLAAHVVDRELHTFLSGDEAGGRVHRAVDAVTGDGGAVDLDIARRAARAARHVVDR
jgi:hydroxymethylbilane synthase